MHYKKSVAYYKNNINQDKKAFIIFLYLFII